VIVYTGSLLRPLFRYMLKLHFNVGFLDRRGGAIAEELHRQVICTPAKYLQPNIDKKLLPTTIPKYHPATLHFKYINGWEHKLDLSNTSLRNVKARLEYYNEYIELDRAEKGQDDEPEDEDSYIK